MRDPNRMPVLLMKLQELWEKYPDMRFMQLINNLQTREGNDMFYVEDDMFIELIDHFNGF